ncbi:PIG-L family deacetylase [Sulfuriroseicoccus oceanibius]|uniref:PIG-L family deacetylase n=1 Tax=Sulfuriroseicoccus oceanibius TaxID=2707525 RepID=A0A6B3L2B0_9BACT|nr:PIG-L family deacetylase [Sulfuriroseicoccus oceanibius]QQL45637.1 PIG-L family deacetylase [Sulfuriroseicoccus oceanibius]
MRLLPLLALLATLPTLHAVTYSSGDVPRNIDASRANTITSRLTVPQGAGSILDVNVTLDITHSWVGDLTLTLIHPTGTRVTLSSRYGGSADNYTNTTFDQQAATSIASARPPFTGTFRPDGNLDNLNTLDASGTWTLEIYDGVSADGGSLNSWSIDLTSGDMDADDDGLPTTWETANGLDPNDDGSLNIDNGPDGDPDGDGLPNIEEYQQGHDPQTNDFGRAYSARPAKATLLVVCAHPDDEGIFFGGTLPYYTQTQNVPTICISMTSGDYSLAPTVREAEFRSACWEYGLRNHPLFPRFRDYWIDDGDINGTWDIWNDNVLGNGDEAAGKLKATEYVARQIRKFRPEVVITHDENGEYGHSNHKAASIATRDAFAMAADPTVDLDGLAPWQAKKLYIHRYNTNANAVSKLFHDHWESPSINGLTPRQVANNGLAYHATQGTQTVSTAYLTGETASPDFEAHASEEWGLHTTMVGPDPIAPDFTINGTLYSGYAKTDFLHNISIDRDSDLIPDAWESLYSGSNIAINPNEDTDGDTISNLDEFRLGTAPTTPSTNSIPITFAADGTSLSFNIPVANGTGYVGVTRKYQLESSSDLTSWSPVMQGVATGETVVYPVPSSHNRRFYRLILTVE